MVFNRKMSESSVSAGVVLVLNTASGPNVVLLKQKNEHYNRPAEFGEVIDIGPKGGVEPHESDVDAALREVQEETGLTGIKLDGQFKAKIKYEFDQPIGDGKSVHVKKRAIYYTARITEEDIKRIRMSDEHESFEIVPIERAADRIEPSATSKIAVLKQLKLYMAKAREPG